MGLIDINLDETPDTMPIVSAGIRTFTVKDIKPDTDKAGDPMHVMECEIEEPDSEENGWKMWDRFNFKYDIAKVNFKKFCKACGHGGSGSNVDTADLIGCTFKAAVKHKVLTDPDSGESREVANIGKYLFEGE